MNFNKPIRFMPNRVWRAYIGGKLMDKYLYDKETEDGHFPEDWLASVTVAQNYANQQFPEEGLVRVRNEDGSEGHFFRDLLTEFSDELIGNNSCDLGVLCKYLDSAIRLPLQCHPDKEFALKYLNSPNGKTESWFVLATRRINGEEPYLLMGFKENIDANLFKKAVREQDIETMKNTMHKIPVKAGDMYFIPGRLPHAIGPGVFLLEVQEPTDWVVQPEQYLGDTELSYQEMYGPLDVETALECFDYEAGGTLNDIICRCRLAKKPVAENENYRFSEIIGPSVTDCFSVYEIDVKSDCRIALNNWAIAVVTDGSADINDVEVKKGDYFFIPYTTDMLNINSSSKMKFFLISSMAINVL